MRQSIYDLWPCVWQLDFICNTALDPSIRESVAMKLLLGGFSQEVHDDQLILRSWQSAGFSHNNCLPIAAGCTMRACWGVKHVARAQLEWTALQLCASGHLYPQRAKPRHRAFFESGNKPRVSACIAPLFLPSLLLKQKMQARKAFWGMVNSGPSRLRRRPLS